MRRSYSIGSRDITSRSPEYRSRFRHRSEHPRFVTAANSPAIGRGKPCVPAELAEETDQPLADHRQNDCDDRNVYCPKDREEHVTSSSPCVLTLSIKNAALVDPTWDWPQLIGGRPLPARLRQATHYHGLYYDALRIDLFDLRRLS